MATKLQKEVFHIKYSSDHEKDKQLCYLSAILVLKFFTIIYFYFQMSGWVNSIKTFRSGMEQLREGYLYDSNYNCCKNIIVTVVIYILLKLKEIGFL